MACGSMGQEWLHPARKTLEREGVRHGACTCTCGDCDIDGLGPDAGSKSREVDNKIITRAEP